MGLQSINQIFTMMKGSIFYILSTLVASSILCLHIGVHKEIERRDSLCEAFKSLINLDVLAPPLNVQLIDPTFEQCINTSYNVTVFINLVSNRTRLISKSSVVMVEMKSDLVKNLSKLMNYNSYHLIIVRNHSFGDLDKMVYHFWKNLRINVSFLIVDTHSDILMQTFIPYSADSCNDTMLQTINKFNEQTQKWQTKNFFPDKLRNFYGCPLKIVTHRNVIPYVVGEEKDENGQRVLKGRMIFMINALSWSLNFTVDLDYNSSWIAFDDSFRKIANNEADIFMGNVAIDAARVDSTDYTFPIFYEFLRFVVPPGKRNSHMENFARVFDSITWTLILIVFLLVGAIVAFISFRSKKLRIYVFGNRHENAFMDYLATIFGLSISAAPNMLVPRLVIMKFVIFCLVIRTIYQGSLYNFLQSGANAKPVQSINEMISKGFTFFMVQSYADFLDLSSQNYASKKAIVLADFDGILAKISDSNFKGSLMHTGSLIEYYNTQENRNKSIFCKEYLMSIPLVAYLRKNFYLTDIVNEKIGLFHAAGLIEFWNKKSKSAVRKHIRVTDDRKHSISVENLGGLFVIYAYACGTSILLWLAEIFLHFTKRSFNERHEV